MICRVVSALLASCLALFTSATAFAHTHLISQTPAADAAVTASPKAITLTFSEGVEQPFSRVTLTDASSQPITVGSPQRSATNPVQLTVPVNGLLRVGVYDVQWQVVSVDGHKTRGSYRFTVK